MIVHLNQNQQIAENGWGIETYQQPSDPVNVFRLQIKNENWKVELYPSKGLSVGQAIYKGQKIFWDAPTSLTDPDSFDPLDGDVYINGNPAPGFSFLKTFSSGIEFYGMRNWGMPTMGDSGKLYPLHGETSNIPLDKVLIEHKKNEIIISGTFEYRTLEGNGPQWYKSGSILYQITRTFSFQKDAKNFLVVDSIKNVSTKTLIPDWGYHLTFYPKTGTKLILPSKKAEKRGGGFLPDNITTWFPAEDEKKRTEIGIIHKQLQTFNTKFGKLCKGLIINPGQPAIEISFTASPYIQTWFCNGGANSSEFTYKNGKPVFKKNWDGLGIEFGSSALDHDDNIDQTVDYDPELKPLQSKNITLFVEIISLERTELLKREFEKYNNKLIF